MKTLEKIAYLTKSENMIGEKISKEIKVYVIIAAAIVVLSLTGGPKETITFLHFIFTMLYIYIAYQLLKEFIYINRIIYG